MELFCEFSEHKSIYTDDVSYKCQVTKIERFASNGRVLNIQGAHVDGKSNQHVESISFFDQQIENFPRYLCNFFPNLKSISIIGCGLKNLTKFDFIGCEGIEKLMLNGNKIKSLSSDVFEYIKNLEIISFFDNGIDFVDVNAFDCLKKLYYVNFKMNPTIDCCLRDNNKENLFLDEIKTILMMIFGGKIEARKGNSNLCDVFEFLENFKESSKIIMEDDYNSRIDMMFQRS